MVTSLIRFIKGYVFFEAQGRFTERFLNLCASHGINIWNYKGEKNKLSGCASVSDYKKMHFAARKSAVKLKHTKKLGLPFIVSRNRIKAGLLCGMAAGLLLIYILSGFIWTIQINGNENLSKYEIITALADNGLYTGVCKGGLNVKKLERDLSLQLKDIGWLTVNITGTNAELSISETMASDKNSQAAENELPCNLKSTQSGQIVKMKVARGQSCVNIGDGVAKNQLLVSGIVQSEEGEASFVHSSGEIIAQLSDEKQFTINKTKKALMPSGVKAEKTSVNFMGLIVPTSFVSTPVDKTFFCTPVRQKLCINGISLPVMKKSEIYTEYEENIYNLSNEQCLNIAETEMYLYEAFNEQDTNIIDRKITESENEKSCTLKVLYTLQKNIAEQVNIGIVD